MKIEKKLIDSATNKVMDVVFESDKFDEPKYRIKFYRKVAWDLLTLAAQMEIEAEMFENENKEI